jgi:hypothetical protein
MTRTPLLLLATTGLLALASCGPRDSSTGELNNGKFSYLCVNSGDASCDDAVSNHPIPDLLAVGGAFDLEYAGDSAGSAPVQIEPSSEVMISAASGHFKFLLPGVAAVLARNTSGGVADFIHLHAAGVEHLDVTESTSIGAATTVEMTTDNDVTLRVTPMSAESSLLSGALQYTWASSNENVVTVKGFGATNHTTLTGIAPGTATVMVSLPSGVKRSVLVTVTWGNKPTTTSSGSSGQGGSGGSATTTTTTGAGGAGGGK